MSSGGIYLQSNLNRITVETAQQCCFFVCTIERGVVAQRRRGEFTMRGTSQQAPSASTLPHALQNVLMQLWQELVNDPNFVAEPFEAAYGRAASF